MSKKYPRKFECPFCDKRDTRDNLIVHINDKHEDMIPEGYSARRVMFNKINNTDHGICRICGKNTPWNEAAGKYSNLCGSEECKNKFVENTKKNYVRVLGTDNPADDEERQKKMLAGRKISGTYTFQNGQKIQYTGSYERKLLEFEESLGFRADDIVMPGPTVEYEYDGKKHFWITDQLLIPYNLVMDVKDGGKHPNTRPMEDYRAKQIAKEISITQLGEYNYLRLTDNDFGQLLAVFAELKYNALFDENGSKKKKVIHVNEFTSTMVGIDNKQPYVINYGMVNTFEKEEDRVEGQLLSYDLSKGFKYDSDKNTLVEVSLDSFLQDRQFSIFHYLKEVGDFSITSSSTYNIYESLVGIEYTDEDQMKYDSSFREVRLSSSYMKLALNEVAKNAMRPKMILEDETTMDIVDPILKEIRDSKLFGMENVTIQENVYGYFAKRKGGFSRSSYYKTIASIPDYILKELNN